MKNTSAINYLLSLQKCNYTMPKLLPEGVQSQKEG